MRFLLAVVLLFSAGALAQNGGSWGGYVSGWGGQSAFHNVPLVRPGPWQRPRVYVPPPVVWFSPPSYSSTQASSTEAQQARATQAQASLQLELQATREQLALEQRQAAAQAQLAARERQLAAEEFAAHERLAAEEQRLAEERRAAQEQADRQREELRRQEERLADARAAAPRTKGNDIYHWVDADGVEVYSTRPPPSARR